MINKDHSVGLEHDDYEKDIELVIKDAIAAIADTGVGYYINVVTPAVFGNPMYYLTEVLEREFGDEVRYHFIDQCGCGGYVLRVWRLAELNERLSS